MGIRRSSAMMGLRDVSVAKPKSAEVAIENVCIIHTSSYAIPIVELIEHHPIGVERAIVDLELVFDLLTHFTDNEPHVELAAVKAEVQPLVRIDLGEPIRHHLQITLAVFPLS